MNDPLVGGCDSPLATRHDVALLDLDGVLYVGPDAVPGAPEAVRDAAAAGMRPAYVTNNAARTPATVAAHLREIGVPAADDDVVTSAQAAATLLAARVPAGSPVLVVGGEGLVVAVSERGLQPVHEAGDGVAAVVQGFAPEVGWRLLAEGTYAVAAGLPWIATNMDATVPTPGGRAPGNGLLVGVVAGAAGRSPDAVARQARDPAARRVGAPHRCARPRWSSATGWTPTSRARTGRASRACSCSPVSAARPTWSPRGRSCDRPTWPANLRDGLLAAHPGVEQAGDRWRCGGWTVTVRDAAVSVEGSGDPVDGLRALCVGLVERWCPPWRGRTRARH